ncbi:ATP-binding cassette domain-containing protein [bacterium]|nr:ATP-binding cassette domain-containing protein [bacterium]
MSTPARLNSLTSALGTATAQRSAASHSLLLQGLSLPSSGRTVGGSQRYHAAVADALARVDMADLAQRQIGELSGGQRRRVFLARAIAADPEIYLLDEPVTGVDPTTQEKIMNILDAEAARGRTVVATTHDLACAAQRFHDVVALAERVIAHGPAQLVLDQGVLEKTYGGHLVPLAGGGVVLLDDPHHSHGAHEGHE